MDEEKCNNKLIRMLKILLSESKRAEEKREILSEEYHISMSRKEEEDLKTMCNLSDLIEEKGIEKGIREMVLDNIEEGIGVERICEKLCRRFLLSKEKASEYLKKYAGEEAF